MGAEGWVQEETAVLWPPSGDVSVQERVLLYALDGPDSDGSGLPETEWKFTVGGEELFCRPLYPASPEGEAAEEEAVASILFGNGTTALTTPDPSLGALLANDYGDYDYEYEAEAVVPQDPLEPFGEEEFFKSYPEVAGVDQICTKSGSGEGADRTVIVLRVDVECGPAVGVVERELDNTALVRIESSIEGTSPCGIPRPWNSSACSTPTPICPSEGQHACAAGGAPDRGPPRHEDDSRVISN